MLPGELEQLRRLVINPANATTAQLLKVILKLDTELQSLGKDIQLPKPSFSSGKPNRGEPNRGQP